MRIIAWLALFSMTSFPPAFATDTVPPQIPLRDFFRNPEISGFQLSPNGEALAYVRPYENRLNVFVRPRQGGDEKRLTSVTDRDVTAFFWKGDRYVLFLKDNNGDENFHLYVVDRDGKEVRDLTPFDGVRAEMIDDLEDHPTDVIVGLNKRN